MIIWINIFIIIFLLYEHVGNAELVLNALAFNFDRYNQFYDSVIEQFNKYANATNQDIKIELKLLSGSNIGSLLDDSRSVVEAVLKSKANKYDIYFYETTYVSLYGSYLLDLNNYLSHEFVDMYDSRVISELCHFSDKLIGIPIFLLYTGFYYNRPLLEQYKKRVPKTWDEMIETGKYILSEEKKNNNTDLSGFNGLFNDSDQGILSILEFIYSFRDSVEADFPEVGSKSFIDALEMMKKIKKELSSNMEFQSDESYTFNKIMNGQSVFLKYWILGEPLINEIKYGITNLPGSKEGVSTSIPSGCNIGIYGKIDEEKKEAAINALKFIASKEVQREYLKARQLISAINSLYYDREVCENSDCDMFINMQPLNDPVYSLRNVKKFENFKNYIYDYLYDDDNIITVDEVIKNIIDITKIYQISLDTTYSNVGLISAIVIIVLILFMLISLIALFRENFNPFFKYLSVDFWIISVIGSIVILCILFTYFGEITTTKCFMYSLIQSLGFSLTFVPIMYKLIVKFPTANQISTWVKKFKYIFLSFFIILDIIWNSLLYIKSFKIDEIIVNGGKNFKICKAESTLTKVIIMIKWVYIFIMLFILIFLIFIEWNIRVFHYDLKFFVTVIYIDILAFIFVICFNYIKVYNYITYYLIHLCIYFSIGISNYICIFGFRLFLGFARKTNVKVQFINKINKGFIEDDGSDLKGSRSQSIAHSTCINENDILTNSNYISTNNTNNMESYNHSNHSNNNTISEVSAQQSQSSRSKVFSKLVDYHNNADSIYNSNIVADR